MTNFIERVLRLWSEPLPDGEAAADAFRQLYADPVLVNGTPLPATALVERARGMQRAFAELKAEILSQVDTADHTVIVIRQRGRHVGPFPTPLGDVAPTGKNIEMQIIDDLTIRDGRIVEVRMVADQFGLLHQLGAIALRSNG